MSSLGGDAIGDGDIDDDALADTSDGDGVTSAVGSTDADGDAVELATEASVHPHKLETAITTAIRHGA